ncbi:MAG: 6-phosphogluconolactonase [Kiritimatiellales bacterium]
MKIKRFSSAGELIAHGLETFRKLFPALSAPDGLMLSGGETPLELYRRFAGEKICTQGTLFLSDERYVPVSDPQNNYGVIAPFFGASHIVRVRTELPIDAAAKTFENNLRRIQHIPFGLLGLGTDGHTASLFNLNDAALRDERLAIPVIKLKKPDRISVTPALLFRIKKIVILATGQAKQPVIEKLLKTPETIPAGVALAGHPDVEIWTDNMK